MSDEKPLGTTIIILIASIDKTRSKERGREPIRKMLEDIFTKNRTLAPLINSVRQNDNRIGYRIMAYLRSNILETRRTNKTETNEKYIRLRITQWS